MTDDLKRRMRGDQRPTPILFVDLDGTVRKGFDEIGRFVSGPADVKVFDGVPALLRRYRERGYRVVGVTNQSGVALGYLSLDDMNAALRETVTLCDGQFDRIFSCIHHPATANPELTTCWYRKPRIGMLIAAYDLGKQYPDEFYPPHLALMVGDQPEDEECARNAGVAFRWAADWRRETLS